MTAKTQEHHLLAVRDAFQKTLLQSPTVQWNLLDDQYRYIHILHTIIDKQCLLLGQPLQIEEMRHGGVDQEAKDATQAAVVEGGKGDIARFLGMNDSPLSSPLSRISANLPLPSQNSQLG